MKHRKKDASVFFLLLLCGSVALSAMPERCDAEAKTASPANPNIIFILADDMGYGDVSALNPDGKIKTPRIDRLSEQGMYFTDMHSPSSVCTPTRYGILTGRSTSKY